MADLTLKGLIGATDEVTTAFVAEVFPKIAALVEPIVWLVAVAYWVTLGLQMYNGRAAVALWDIVKRAMLTTLVFTTLNWSAGGSFLYGIWGTWTETISAQIMSNGVNSTSMLDALYVDIGKVASMLMNVNWRQFAMIIMGAGLFAVNCILFIVAVMNMLIAKFGAAIIMCVFPTIIGFVFFEGTRQWTMNWAGKMLNFSFIYILSIAIVRFGYSVFGDAINEAATAATVSDAALITAQQWGTLVIVEGLLIICMLQVRGWAASLASGATVQGSSLVMMALRSVGMGK
ncbi:MULTISPECIES: type IV secretion system protein [Pseudomonas]|uniref:Inner membrane protein of type IV secretion of T-DNA complex, VirB6 n=1 Tax=Pseudomonas syringae pv. actinidiae TaxID=103796 RepID=A0A2P0QFK7_PSESF|nr:MULTISPECIES: type IV secretion system protein [Pseudomonas]APQ06993.1 type VI secretion protein [Pseudomonas syringae pv. actinidiae]ARO44978.1 Inner membrane protein of type IV secretion of T-DNA complex, VirB6 [Pseudomonas syringae pv. actinidiae]ARO45083.1 Inner membrane protein of type IV secretion of T-DNA complex, VirB6 [Pseudomonas syringae pv. actinidiae]ARO45174.1 Inner membrane protein of type IV secretion of T-DNA complex, VirB6 [Pseudomonas syringae pv. actinidiae]ARO45216.1 In